jgi:hypothetical protein
MESNLNNAIVQLALLRLHMTLLAFAAVRNNRGETQSHSVDLEERERYKA